MQVSPSAGQDLAMVDRNPTVPGHYAEQFRLLGPLPATDAGANRRGHRNRLTRQLTELAESRVCRLTTTLKCYWGLTHPRLPSQDDSQVPLGPKAPTSASSR